MNTRLKFAMACRLIVCILASLYFLGCGDDSEKIQTQVDERSGEGGGVNRGESAGVNAGESAGVNAGESAGVNAGQTRKQPTILTP